jgi:imidazolonepropionase-like amidohydrolase
MAHATNPDAVKNAIRLGAHSIEHGYIMDDECVACPAARPVMITMREDAGRSETPGQYKAFLSSAAMTGKSPLIWLTL